MSWSSHSARYGLNVDGRTVCSSAATQRSSRYSRNAHLRRWHVLASLPRDVELGRRGLSLTAELERPARPLATLESDRGELAAAVRAGLAVVGRRPRTVSRRPVSAPSATRLRPTLRYTPVVASSQLLECAAYVRCPAGQNTQLSRTVSAMARPAPQPTGIVGDRTRLILLSFLMLFVELALIRWTGSNVVYLSYFSNFVLLGSFLGIGLGFLRAERRPTSSRFAPVALGALVAFVRLLPGQDHQRRRRPPLLRRPRTDGPAAPARPAVIFIVVAATMALIGEGVARRRS